MEAVWISVFSTDFSSLAVGYSHGGCTAMPAASNASRLIALFGGCTATADAIGEDKATVSRWTSSGKRGTRGKIPPRHNIAIMKAAQRAGFPAQAYACLDLKCPTCGNKWQP